MLTDYFELEKKIYEYFGYVEEYEVIPLDDVTDSVWYLDDDAAEVIYADNLEGFATDGYYMAVIYSQRYVYRRKDYTMIAVDTQCDGNKFLMVFDNKKELKDHPLEEQDG